MARRAEIKGSQRREPDDVTFISESDPEEWISVTVRLKSPPQGHESAQASGSFGGAAPARVSVSPEEDTSTKFAPAVQIFEDLAYKLGLLIRPQPARGTIQLEGTIAGLSNLFNTTLNYYHDGFAGFHAYSGPLRVQPDLLPWVRSVSGLDQRPLVKRRAVSLAGTGDGPAMWPIDIARLYDIPDLDAKGQRVAVIALEGGYDLHDLNTAQTNTHRPLINRLQVIDQSVGGVQNSFQSGQSVAERELALDLQVLTQIVPSVTIIVYFTKNSITGLEDALQAVLDSDPT